MFSTHKIKFYIDPILADLKEIHPEPTVIHTPEWFKKVSKHTIYNKTIKGCMPFLDAITAGYVLKLSEDIHISFNVDSRDKKGEKDTYFLSGTAEAQHFVHQNQLNINAGHPQTHDNLQLGEKNNFINNKNKNLPFLKILNPFIIKTPPGYSCLFIPPLMNENDYFHALPGIVDTDKFDLPINFPIVANGDKYNTFTKTFPRGMPYIQVIPFKRESWKMEVIKSKPKFFMSKHIQWMTKLLNNYKTSIWSKKKWK